MARVIAYTYEADYHCPDCACNRFYDCAETPGKEDKNGVLIDAKDNEGNPIHPVFETDELDQRGVHCFSCGTEISKPIEE